MTGIADVMDENGVAVASAAAATLTQCAALVRELEQATYCKPSQTMGGGTIGQHVRHSLDHFVAALTSDDQHIDYDTRVRGTNIETEPAEALALVAKMVEALERKTSDDLRAPVAVHVMLSGDGQRAVLASTLERELWFASHHAIHHHAMIGAIAKEFGLAVDPTFGKAPSTIDFERRVPAGH